MEYVQLTVEDEPLSFQKWVDHNCAERPQFRFWHDALEIELTVSEFVKANRTASFELYKESLEQLMPWIFILDHINYSRDLPVHLRDMCALEKTHPSVLKHFIDGKFVGQKSQRSFSSIALDQMHEQLIGSIKGDGGIIGITENPEALRRFMISGPELARIVEEFEQSTFHTTDSKHHEQYPKFQSKFKEDVKSLIKAFSNTGNPFLEDSKDLISLETSAIMPPDVVTNIMNEKDNGRKLCDKFFFRENSNCRYCMVIHSSPE